MRKIITLTLLLSATMIASAQRMTIKTASGQVVEISCDGMMPSEVQVEGDKVTFKMNNEMALGASKASVAEAPVAEAETEASANVAEAPVAEAETEVSANVAEAPVVEAPVAEAPVAEELVAEADSVESAGWVNSLAEELSPEYKAFNEEHANDNPQEVMTNLAKGVIGEEGVETVNFFSTMFSGLRFTKDTTFVAKYEQRKPKPAWRHYDVLELYGSFGKNIEGVSDAMAEQVSEGDYGDDTTNENKFGGGGIWSRVNIKGTIDEKGNWKPNPLGLAWSWGGLVDYSFEKDMGSYISVMGKAGVQIGNEITFGVDALLGGGVTPYNTFYTNGMNHSVLNKSEFCFKMGLRLWGSLNYSKNTYTTFYGRYIRSMKPNGAMSELPEGWDMIVEDFDPSSWGVGLAVGYKFGAPEALSTDKRLQSSFSTGYQFIGKQKGLLVSSELEYLTKVSHSTSLNYGLSVEQLFGQNHQDKNRYTSVLFSGGFKVNQPYNRWFWGAKLYAGVGDVLAKILGKVDDLTMENSTKKLCFKTALQLSGGIKFGKLSEVFGALRFGCHFGKSIDVDGLDGVDYINLNGFEGDARLGYRYTF